MPLRDDQATLRQMLAHAREAQSLVVGKSRADLVRERVLALALVQLLQPALARSHSPQVSATHVHPLFKKIACPCIDTRYIAML